VEISDNGAGMDDDALQKIFEPYFTSKSKGAGLGLTNTQNIILNHKGNISVKSKPGSGTSFFIQLNLTP
jgi:signal transduction histidine kinase